MLPNRRLAQGFLILFPVSRSCSRSAGGCLCILIALALGLMFVHDTKEWVVWHGIRSVDGLSLVDASARIVADPDTMDNPGGGLVTGVIRNTSGHTLDNCEVDYRVYTADGGQLDSSASGNECTDTKDELLPGQTWHFACPFMDFARADHCGFQDMTAEDGPDAPQ